MEGTRLLHHPNTELSCSSTISNSLHVPCVSDLGCPTQKCLSTSFMKGRAGSQSSFVLLQFLTLIAVCRSWVSVVGDKRLPALIGRETNLASGLE